MIVHMALTLLARNVEAAFVKRALDASLLLKYVSPPPFPLQRLSEMNGLVQKDCK